MYCSMQYICSIPLCICDKVLFSVHKDVHVPVTDPLGKTAGKCKEGAVVPMLLHRQVAVLAGQAVHTRLHHLKGHLTVLLTQSISWWWCKASYRIGRWTL